MRTEMSHRLQITLTDAQYRRLQDESNRTGASLAELTRQAVEATYPPLAPLEQRLKWLDEAFGAWADREDDFDAMIRQLRPPMGPGPD
ncbi:MAG: hypothetical protein ACRDKV_04320 [Solirubrobacterales bacterium]